MSSKQLKHAENYIVWTAVGAVFAWEKSDVYMPAYTLGNIKILFDLILLLYIIKIAL